MFIPPTAPALPTRPAARSPKDTQLWARSQARAPIKDQSSATGITCAAATAGVAPSHNYPRWDTRHRRAARRTRDEGVVEPVFWSLPKMAQLADELQAPPISRHDCGVA
jgi:hypothetical protein